ncbi:uncharacterized protein VNE69_06177 [Vairimorpha necatrix]|uniref:Uncharacterized protein n=1 Tax=Vairimorpha necatrix TaxID=6039 RepID=A0AAX4JCX7_9MICR
MIKWLTNLNPYKLNSTPIYIKIVDDDLYFKVEIELNKYVFIRMNQNIVLIYLPKGRI